MRARRYTRRELKSKLDALTVENNALKVKVQEMEESTTVADSPADKKIVAVNPASSSEPTPLATPIICGGFPTKISAVKARDLKEAKALAMEYLARC